MNGEAINRQSRPYLPRHVRLHFDPVREKYAVLAPEKVFWPDEVAVYILQLLDGKRDLNAIAGELSEVFDAPHEMIAADTLSFLQLWHELRLVRI